MTTEVHDRETERLPFYLRDNFAPIFDEYTDTELAVSGSIPPELNGRFFRNGPNPQTGRSAHWFLGNGMIHGVELRDGRANWYRNRYVRTALFENPQADAVESMGDLRMSAANTHIIRYCGKILALEEAHLPFEVSPELETVGAHDFGGRLQTAMTAHPKICPETGELLFFAYGLTPPYLTYYRASAEGELVQSEQIDMPAATMIHDFAVTRSHVIFMDLPVVWDLAAMERGLPLRWSDEHGARLGVMARDGKGSDIVWYEIEPCYVYHPMNAFEDEQGRITIDVCRMPHTMKPGAIEVQPRLHRWTINRAAGSVTETALDDRAVEFPRVHDERVGGRHRYGYTAGLEEKQSPNIVRFHKYDLVGDRSWTHELGPGRTGGEPVFAPASAGGAAARDAADDAGEDEGWVMSFVHDAASDRSELVILDASNFEAEPVARIHLPTRVPNGFHGSWIPDEEKV